MERRLPLAVVAAPVVWCLLTFPAETHARLTATALTSLHASKSPESSNEETIESGSPAQASRNPKTSKDQESNAGIRIAVLYKDTPTGHRHLKGIRESTDAHPLVEQGKVEIVPIPYASEDEGVGRLLSLITEPIVSQPQKRTEEREGDAEAADESANDGAETRKTAPMREEPKIDIVIGPTESGVYVRALAERKARQKEGDHRLLPVPVISGLVAAREGNAPGGWFFRINMDAGKRADSIYNLLRKYWVRSITVLYADTEFGRQAEQEFQKRLTPNQKEHYMSVLYETPPNVSGPLREIIEKRPEALGFFGEREDIAQIYRTMSEVNAGVTEYRPMFFTVVDARWVATRERNVDIYCVTISPINAEKTGELRDDALMLGKETGLLILNELQRFLQKAGKDTDSFPVLSRKDRLEFRNQFSALLSRSGPMDEVALTFTNLQNSSRRNVIHITSDGVHPVNVNSAVGLPEKLRHKVGLILGSYGWWPILCITTILVIVAWLNWRELDRLFEGSGKRVFGSGFFLAFTAAHLVTVVALYVFLAETGAIRYDSWLLVIGLSLAPTALLRTTFFETAKGKAIGLEGLHERLRMWVDDELMKARHTALQAKVNLIAYSNSVFVMQRALMEVYRSHPSPVRAGRLVQELEETIRNESDYFERRRKCAYRLLKQLGWEQLRTDGFVSASWVQELSEVPAERDANWVVADSTAETEGAEQDEERVEHEVLMDPRRIVRMAVQHCMRDRRKQRAVREEVDKYLAEMERETSEREQELKDFYEAECQKALAPDGLLNVRIRFLFVLSAFDVEKLVEMGFLEQSQVADYRSELKDEHSQDQDRESLWLRNYLFNVFPAFFQRVFGHVKKLLGLIAEKRRRGRARVVRDRAAAEERPESSEQEVSEREESEAVAPGRNKPR